MANCKMYQQLTVPEKWELIGKVIHSLQNDSTCFQMAAHMVNYAQEAGVLNGVEILPPPITYDSPPINEIP